MQAPKSRALVKVSRTIVRIIVRGAQTFELLPRHLPADQAGDLQDCRINLAPRLPIAVVVRSRLRKVTGVAVFIFDHRRSSPKKSLSRVCLGLAASAIQ
jgi:hypothetical protein